MMSIHTTVRRRIPSVLSLGCLLGSHILSAVDILELQQPATLDSAYTGANAIEKSGSEDLSIVGLFPGAVYVSEGGLNLSGSSVSYTHYRFKVEDVSGWGNEATCMEIGEFRLLRNGVDVTSGFQSVSNCSVENGGGGNPDGEGPGNAVDGKDWTKFLDYSIGRNQSESVRDRCWLMLTYSEPLEITGYNWASCDYRYNTRDGRYPVAWRFQGSNDGVTWIDLDVQTTETFTPTFAVKVWQSEEGFDVHAGEVSGLVALSAGAEVSVSGNVRIGGLFSEGTVNLSENAQLRVSVPSGESSVLAGAGINGLGGIVKEGDGTLYSLGGNGYSGQTCVRGGQMVFGPPEGIAAKWFRVTFRRIAKNTPALIDLSEWCLYDKDGTRQGMGMALASAGTDPRDLLPGSCCLGVGETTGSSSETPEKMFDGEVTTKLCLNREKVPSPGDPSSWRQVVVRLPDSASPVVSYNFVKGMDNGMLERSPNNWLLEASFDGWHWFSVDEVWDLEMTEDGGEAYNGGEAFEVGAYTPSSASPAKWFRVTFKKVYTGYGTPTVMDMSEWVLLDADGARCGYAPTLLPAGTSAVDMPPGSCCLANADWTTGSSSETPEKLFDSDTGTKLCLTIDSAFDANDASSWRTVVVRLREGEPAVASYQFYVGNDNYKGKGRSAQHWVVESSLDGVNWIPVDERLDPVLPSGTSLPYNEGVPFTFSTPPPEGTETPALPIGSALEVTGGSIVLNGNFTVDTLKINGVQQLGGRTYGSSSSGASVKDDIHFVGTGVLRVLTPPLGLRIVVR